MLLLIATICLIALEGCKKKPPEKIINTAEVGVISTPTVSVIPSREYSVRTTAVNSVNLEARVQGYLMKRVFTEGAYVKKGQILFEIDPAGFKVAVDKAKANLESNQAKATEDEKNLARGKNLLIKKLISQETYDGMLSNARQSFANVKIAKTELEQAELDLSYTKIIAPFDGMVGMANYHIGSLVGPGAALPLAQITSIDPIHVLYQVSERELLTFFSEPEDLSPLKKSLYFSLKLTNGRVYSAHGTLDYISPVVNKDTDTVTLRVSFPNPDGILRPGMYAVMRACDTRKQILPVIPQLAIQQGRQGAFVYVVKNGKASTVTVTPGKTMGDGRQAILKGLEKGDLVVVSGFMDINNGAKVHTVKMTVTPDGTITVQKLRKAG